MSKTILITGGTGKIGSQLVSHLVKKGDTVIVVTRDIKNFEALVNNFKLDKYRNRLNGCVIDLLAKSFLTKIVKYLSDSNLQVNSIIHCARNLSNLAYLENSHKRIQQWQREYLLDVVIPFELSMAMACDHKNNLSDVIMVGSMYGVVAANPNLYNNPLLESPAHYSVAKAALIHATKELAVRLNDKKIKVNSVSYGGVKGRTSPDFLKRYQKLCPSGSMLKIKEVIGAIEFLLSKKSNGMLGHNLVVDGGWSIW